MTRNTRELVSPETFAAELGLPPKTLAEWRSRGIGPAYYKVGKHVRYAREDIDRWIASQRRETEHAATP